MFPTIDAFETSHAVRVRNSCCVISAGDLAHARVNGECVLVEVWWLAKAGDDLLACITAYEKVETPGTRVHAETW